MPGPRGQGEEVCAGRTESPCRGVALRTPPLARAGGQAASPGARGAAPAGSALMRLGCERLLRHSSGGGASPAKLSWGLRQTPRRERAWPRRVRDSRDNAQEVTPPHCKKGHSRIYKA